MWKRGSKIHYARDESKSPVARLGIDSGGIKKVESFASEGCLDFCDEKCLAV
jgi:hypothetical protein